MIINQQNTNRSNFQNFILCSNYVQFLDNRIYTNRYTKINFLFRFFFEFYHSSIFFPIIIFTVISTNHQSSPFKSLPITIGVLLVMLIILCQYLYKDYKCIKSDREYNSKPILIYNYDTGLYDQKRWDDLTVGDVFIINNDQQIPCDCVVLESSHADGMFFIETSNMDGESGIKMRPTLHNFRNLSLSDSKSISDYAERWTGPNLSDDLEMNINKFDFVKNERLRRSKSSIIRGFDLKFYLNSTWSRTMPKADPKGIEIRLRPNQWNRDRIVPQECIVMRGSTLKHTHQIIAASIYCGMDSQTMLNIKIKANKITRVQRTIETVTYWTVIFVFVTSLVMSSVLDAQKNALNRLVYFALILFQLIPMSTPTLMIILQFLQSYKLEKDKRYKGEIKIHNEYSLSDFARVQYFCTDKTGTLTTNSLNFHFISYPKGSKGSFKNFKLKKTLENFGIFSKKIENQVKKSLHLRESIKTILICNSVLINPEYELYQQSDKDSGPDVEQYYISVDQDERALLSGLSRIRCSIVMKNSMDIQISIFGQILDFCFTDIRRDFDSNTKYQLVQVKRKDKYFTYVKGAFENVKNLIDPLSMPPSCLDEVKYLYNKCYRIMVLAYHESSDKMTLEDIESSKKLYFLSFTAIEDQLRPNVAETINKIRRAGIRLAIITGDNCVTAGEIAIKSGMVSRNNHRLVLSPESGPFTFERFQEMDDLKSNEYAIFDSDMIREAMKCKHKLAKFISLSPCTVFGRTSPDIKASIVSLYKNYLKRGQTTVLVAGDGLNDLAMFEESSVSVALQTQQNNMVISYSDVSINNFGYLSELILVDGPWMFQRFRSVLIFYYLRLIILNTPNFLFTLYSKLSTISLHEEYSINLYYLTWLFPTVISLGLFDKFRPSRQLRSHPELYYANTLSDNFDDYHMAFWILYGCVIGIIIYMVPFYIIDKHIIVLPSGNVASFHYLRQLELIETTMISFLLGIHFLNLVSIANCCSIFFLFIHLIIYYSIWITFVSKFYPENILIKAIFVDTLRSLSFYTILFSVSTVAFATIFIILIIRSLWKRQINKIF